MADNVTFQSTTLATPPAGQKVATDEVAYSGDTVAVQIIELAAVFGAEGARTIERLSGDTANGLDVDVTRSALPSGASTEATLATRLSESDFDIKTGSLTETAPASDTASSGLNGRLQRIAQRLTSLIALLPVSLGQKVMSDSLAVVVASDQSAIPISGTISLSGAVDTELPAAATLTDNTANPTAPAVGSFNHVWNGASWDRMPGTSADGVTVNLGVNNDVTVTGTAAVTQSGTWTVQPGNTPNTTAWLVKENRAGTATRTQVADSATDVSLLASNADRLKVIVHNDSSALLYLGFGATAVTSTNYTYRIYPNGTLEVDQFTGELRGIWASDPNDGGAKITELT